LLLLALPLLQSRQQGREPAQVSPGGRIVVSEVVCNALGPTHVVVPTRVFPNAVWWLEPSSSLEALPARVDPADLRFRVTDRARSSWI
jgi:hypothetical protein